MKCNRQSPHIFWGRWLCLSAPLSWDPSWSTAFWRPQAHGHIGVSPEEGCKNDHWAGAPLLWTDAVRTRDVQPGEKSREAFIVTFQCLKGACKNDGDKHFSRACCDPTRGKGFKLKVGRFRLDIKETHFIMRVWNSGTRCPERWKMPHQLKHSRSGWWWSEKHDVVEDVPAHFKARGLGDL